MKELMIDLVPDRGRVCEASMMFPKQSVSRHYPSHPRQLYGYSPILHLQNSYYQSYSSNPRYLQFQSYPSHP